MSDQEIESYGLVLTGLLVASQVKSGLKRDDGKPWVLMENVITTGVTSFKHVESLDVNVQDHEPLVVDMKNLKAVTVVCETADTNMGMTTVRGKLVRTSVTLDKPSIVSETKK